MSLPANSDAMVALVFLLGWAAKITLLLACAGAAAFALRRQSAALRHQVWTIAIVGALGLPLLSVALPAWHLLDAPRTTSASLPAATVSLVMSGDGIASLPIPPHNYLRDLIGLALIVWALGTLFILLRLVANVVRLLHIAAYSKIAPADAWRAIVDELRASFGIRRRLRLLECANTTTMPMTCGIFRPWIMLPASAAGWDCERRKIVLSHELAHIARGDWLFQICGEALRACFWFHPLAWIAANRLRQESERACDDAVLNSGIAAPEYANQLLVLAQTLRDPRRRLSLALAVARPSSLERRFAAMLNPTVNRRPLSRATGVFAAFLATSLLLPLAALTLSAAAPPAQTRVNVNVPVVTTSVSAVVPPSATTSIQTRAASSASAAPGPTSEAQPNSPREAQNTSGATGNVAGIVTDPSGAIVPNASVVLTNAQTGAELRASTDATGRFSFNDVPVVEYVLHVAVPGFRTYDAKILFDSGTTISLDARLLIGDVTQTVEVSASRNGPGISSDNQPTTADGAPCPAATPEAASPLRSLAPGMTRVGGVVDYASITCNVRPVYPASARAAGAEGTVTIQAVIGKDGTLLSPRVVNADLIDSALAQAALDAVSQWRYSPATLNGQPIEVLTEVNVVYTLRNNSAQDTPSAPPPAANNSKSSPQSAAAQSTTPQSATEAPASTNDLAKQGVTILSSTEGVDFSPYLKALLQRVKTQWYGVMPREALTGTKGKVGVVFTIRPGGSLSTDGPAISAGSGVVVLDKAAMDAIRNSVPFDPLPKEFHGPLLKLQMMFVYNEPLDAASN
jgi:TonB family protein